MKNKEKYLDNLMDILIAGGPLAIDKCTNMPVNCCGFDCRYCLVNDSEKECCNGEIRKKWLEA